MVIIAALVLAAFSIVSTQDVKADSTSQVSVLTYSFYTAPANTVLASAPGDLIVVGELENVGSNVIANVTLQCIAFGASEQQLATTSTNAFVFYTQPGQKVPFYFDLNAASSSTDDLSWVSSVTSVAISVTSVTDVPNNQEQYSGLTIPASSPYLPGNGTYYVIGTIVNSGNQTASYPWVVATFYNSAGTVIGMNFTDELTTSLTPGEAWRFYASPADDTTILTGEIANYTLTVDSLTLSNSSYIAPSSSPSASSSSSSPLTKSSTLIVVVAAVVVVVLVVVVAALMLIKKRQKAPQAPQTPPTPETTQPPPPPPPPTTP